MRTIRRELFYFASGLLGLFVLGAIIGIGAVFVIGVQAVLNLIPTEVWRAAAWPLVGIFAVLLIATIRMIGRSFARDVWGR